MAHLAWDEKALLERFVKAVEMNANKPVVPHVPLDLNPVADAIRDGLQSIANSLALIRKADELDKLTRE